MSVSNHSRSAHSSSTTKDVWHERLTTAIDVGIASTVLVAPLFMGGRGPVGRFVFVLCVAITASLWCIRDGTNSVSSISNPNPPSQRIR